MDNQAVSTKLFTGAAAGAEDRYLLSCEKNNPIPNIRITMAFTGGSPARQVQRPGCSMLLCVFMFLNSFVNVSSLGVGYKSLGPLTPILGNEQAPRRGVRLYDYVIEAVAARRQIKLAPSRGRRSSVPRSGKNRVRLYDYVVRAVAARGGYDMSAPLRQVHKSLSDLTPSPARRSSVPRSSKNRVRLYDYVVRAVAARGGYQVARQMPLAPSLGDLTPIFGDEQVPEDGEKEAKCASGKAAVKFLAVAGIGFMAGGAITLQGPLASALLHGL